MNNVFDAQRGNRIFSFPELNRQTFLGLPGLLSDALPDKFGNSIINAWLARNGRDVDSFDPIERLCYTGKRAMGVLEFEPPVIKHLDQPVPVEVAGLTALAQEIMVQQLSLNVDISDSEKTNTEAIMDILRVGTSADGARPKAVIAMDNNGNVMSGQTNVPDGYDYWLLKFDGVTDLELGAPKGYGRIEYAYYLMAQAAGIHMMECRLLEENNRAHFLTKRFDRNNHKKIHMQSLCGLAYYDFNQPGAYGYEQAFSVMRRLQLTKAEAVQQYRRMIFNVIARNQDDHTKNIAFLMDRQDRWTLSPAFDVTYSHNPAGKWTNMHQMSINGKRDHFMFEDIVSVGEAISIRKPFYIIQEVIDSVKRWPEFGQQAGVKKTHIAEIAKHHRLSLFSA